MYELVYTQFLALQKKYYGNISRISAKLSELQLLLYTPVPAILPEYQHY